jgi:hypothetical protein
MCGGVCIADRLDSVVGSEKRRPFEVQGKRAASTPKMAFAVYSLRRIVSATGITACSHRTLVSLTPSGVGRSLRLLGCGCVSACNATEEKVADGFRGESCPFRAWPTIRANTLKPHRNC